MGEKSLQKKKYILEKAREVFMEKGYKNVTMKDIVDACEIRRGGLYLYFPGTRELFLEVLKAEQEDSGSEFEQKIGKDFGPADILALFLKEQKRELLTKKGTLQKACYEFFFEENDYSRENLLKKQFDAAVMVIQRLIEEGVEIGEFCCEEPRRAASNIMYVLEGLKVAANTRGVTEAAVDREIMYMMQNLVAEE